ncbi:hypothetical protein GIB67_027720 [Kingdonia uniflora]|uniref:Protein kinase domain-containing protein n=1 Tax=Kingdonia uniflora TaxID=39325 RepID=A0A7J7NLW0_9MAGN|nr:hypothetical protein GIB67_027720 [Kingdonia uniflora]
MQAFHKSHLLKLRVAPSETAMTDVLCEVLIMKILGYPNIVNLIEVIDDLNTDHFYMEFVEGKSVCEGPGLSGSLEEKTTRKYLRDIVIGLMYLHALNIAHRDIKPDNLLVTNTGMVKIGDFSVSQVFEIILLLLCSSFTSHNCMHMTIMMNFDDHLVLGIRLKNWGKSFERVGKSFE